MARKGSGTTRFSTLRAWRATGRMKKRLEIDEKNMCTKEELEVFWFWKMRLVLLSFVVTLLLSFCAHSLSLSFTLSLFGCERDPSSSLSHSHREAEWSARGSSISLTQPRFFTDVCVFFTAIINLTLLFVKRMQERASGVDNYCIVFFISQYSNIFFQLRSPQQIVKY